jgi:hypothetical protein
MSEWTVYPKGLAVWITDEADITISMFAKLAPGQLTSEQAFALEVKNVEQTVTYKPGGNVTVYTKVQGRRPWLREERYSRARLSGGVLQVTTL